MRLLYAIARVWDYEMQWIDSVNALCGGIYTVNVYTYK